jgi:hypothetical protein
VSILVQDVTRFTPQNTSMGNTQMPLVWPPLPSLSPSIGSKLGTSPSLQIMDSVARLGSMLACCQICWDIRSQEGGNVMHLHAQAGAPGFIFEPLRLESLYG